MTYRKELWERQNLPRLKGGGAYKRKRKTKSRLLARIKRKEVDRLPIIDTEVREGADDVQLGVSYEIVGVEDIVTDVQQLSGIRVVLKSPQGDEGSVVLWKRKVTGTTSKLGVFIEALGNNTDRWLHKWIVFRAWLPRDRKIEVLEASVAKKIKDEKKGK
jgi:hypothetical protein